MVVPSQELRKQLEDEQLQADITHAVNCIQTVLDFANEAIHKEHLAAAVVDLSERVDDWKALKMESFGDLLRFGTFQVVKGDSGKDSEREVCDLTFCVLRFFCSPKWHITNMALSTIYISSSEYSFVAKISTPTSKSLSL